LKDAEDQQQSMMGLVQLAAVLEQVLEAQVISSLLPSTQQHSMDGQSLTKMMAAADPTEEAAAAAAADLCD
jgi:hypothetical protein